MFKFVKKYGECEVEVTDDDMYLGLMFLSDDELSNEEVLIECQQWLDDRNLTDVEYKVFIEIH